SSASGSNIGSASWNKTTYGTPNGTASSAGAAFTFDISSSVVSLVNQSITVTDTYNSVTTTLGTVGPATNAPTYPSATYHISKTVTVPATSCASYLNKATITQTGQSSQDTVKVCGPGALTMGFWKNPNGQGLIGAANPSLLGTWLQQFHPFTDA